MWHLQFGNFYFLLSGVEIPSGGSSQWKKVITFYIVLCFAITTTAVLAGFYVFIQDKQIFCFPWVTLSSINYLMVLGGKFVSVVLVTTYRNTISTISAMSRSLHDYVNMQFPNDEVNSSYYLVKSTFAFVVLLCNIIDIWVDNVPLVKIQNHTSEYFTDNSVVQGFVVLFTFPLIWIYYGVQFNSTLTILEELHMYCLISLSLFDAKATKQAQRDLIVHEEDIFTLSNASIPFNDITKLKMIKCSQFAKVHFRIVDLRIRSDQVYSGLLFWHLIICVSSFPLYFVYYMQGNAPSHLTEGLTSLYCVVDILLILLPVVLNIYLNYKIKYSFSVTTSGKMFSFPDERLRKTLSRCVTVSKDPYLVYNQTFCLLDSSVLVLMSDWVFLLLTTLVDHASGA